MSGEITENISVLIVDDHRIFRDGIASMFHGTDGITIAGLASNGVEALGMIPSFRPAVVILDLSMPLMGGLELLRKIQHTPEASPRMLILSMHTDPVYVSEALDAGAHGYVCKESTSREELLEAIKVLMQGETYLGPGVKKILEESAEEKKAKGQGRREKLPDTDLLSKRETEVLRLILEGLSNQEIAEATFVSIRTVETHKNNIMNKLNIKNSVELVKYAIKNNFFEI
jgi:DNA-binding NarL/FixJ family response regulator